MKTDDVLKRFGEMIIARMEQMKNKEWQKGWFSNSYGDLPVNLGGRRYNGVNSFFLLLLMMQEDRFKYPVFATFNQIKNLKASVNKGEKSFPVLFWSMSYKYDDKSITEDDYNSFSIEQKRECEVHPFLKSYNVFNISQTNLEEIAPKTIQRLKEKFNSVEDINTDTFGMYKNPAIDEMLALQKWVCPICYENISNRAFYSPSDDKITIPAKYQFRKGCTDEDIFTSGQEFYSTLLHEMVHSTGCEKRLKRNIENGFGGKDYGREELVAELGAALVGNVLGFSPSVIDNNAAYLNAWIKSIRQQPKFIVSVLSDVNKAVKMILEVVDNVKVSNLVA